MGVSERKSDHLRISREEAVQFMSKRAGFEYVELMHEALPGIDLVSVDTSTSLLGKELSAPVLIAAITGGTKEAEDINLALSKVCENLGIGMGVGSQRAAIEKPELTSTFQVRDVAPNILLLGNLGLVQFCKGYGVEEAIKAVEMIDADGLCIHLNSAQEAVQPEGDTGFSQGLEKLKELCEGVDFPIIAKECGCGMSSKTIKSLVQKGVSGIEVGGAGGTSWVGVEHYRSGSSRLTKTFWDWGIPTLASVSFARDAGVPVIATGGVRTGLDAAKAIALGADAVGVALPVLRAYPDKIEDYFTNFICELRTAMFLTGCQKIKDLKKVDYRVLEPLKSWIE